MSTGMRTKIPDPRQLRQAVIEISQPFVEMKVDLLSRALPRIVVTGEGTFEHIYSDEIVEELAKIEALRQEAVNRYLGEHGGMRHDHERTRHESSTRD